ncbi:MAG TPA: hypothetical protein VI547_06720, partial [Anaerolineales bacterium]|nr:hypothetical protein [Anaerolineales bacterium]
MTEGTQTRSRRGALYGSLIVNAFTLCCLISTVWVCGYVGLLTVNPYTNLNLFQPPTIPAALVLATATETSLVPTLPPIFTSTPTFTATAQPFATDTPVPGGGVTDTPTGSTLEPSPTRLGGGGDTPTPGLTVVPSAAGHILFVSTRNGDPDIAIINPDGSAESERFLVGEEGKIEDAPAMSPDGTKVVFHSDRDGDFEVYVVNIDGSSLTQLTNNSKFDGNAVWSPDGRTIAFDSDRSGNFDIWTMNTDGTGANQLTFSLRDDRQPAMSSTGNEIAFQSNRD